MLATSNFVNQMHNGTVNNNNNSPISDSIPSETATAQMTSNKQAVVVEADFAPNVNNQLDSKVAETNQSNDMNGGCSQVAAQDESQNAEDSVDITISNVVTNFSVRCHLNLRTIASNGSNVVYRRDQSIILMKLRQPNVTASIWSSGKITCTGATTEEQAKSASRKVARVLQKMGFRVKFGSYRIVNVLGSCRLPFGIKITEFSTVHRRLASYEPELHPGATYRIKELKAVLKIFQTGSITITAPSITNVQLAVEHIYPLVYEFRKPKPPRADGRDNPPHSMCSIGSNNHHLDDETADHGDALLYDKLIVDHGDGSSSSSSSDSEA